MTPGYVSGGYLITLEVERPAGMSEDLLPERLVSVAAHIAPRLPDDWLVDWVQFADEERAQRGATMGLEPQELARLRRWVTRRMEDGALGWPCVVRTRETLRELAALLPGDLPYLALELGLASAHVPEFLAENAPAPGLVAGGLYEQVASMRPLAEDGQALGFEVLCTTSGTVDCSWLCNRLEQTCWQELAIRPGRHGLIAREEEADRAAAHVARPEVGAEPGQWLPWLLHRVPW